MTVKVLETWLFHCGKATLGNVVSLLLAEREITRGCEEEKKLETNVEFLISRHRCLREYYSFESHSRIATKMQKCVRDEQN